MEYVRSLFPKEIQQYIKNVVNPLDKTKILVNIFNEKNVRIIVLYEKDKFGDYEFTSYYHTDDLADNCKYSKNNIHHWKDRWDVKFYTYKELMEKAENLPLQNGDPILESNKMFYANIIGRVDKNARFICEQDLKMILMNINTEEAKVFRN